MAGIQEQIRQLEEINNDILEDEHRYFYIKFLM